MASKKNNSPLLTSPPGLEDLLPSPFASPLPPLHYDDNFEYNSQVGDDFEEVDLEGLNSGTAQTRSSSIARGSMGPPTLPSRKLRPRAEQFAAIATAADHQASYIRSRARAARQLRPQGEERKSKALTKRSDSDMTTQSWNRALNEMDIVITDEDWWGKNIEDTMDLDDQEPESLPEDQYSPDPIPSGPGRTRSMEPWLRSEREALLRIIEDNNRVTGAGNRAGPVAKSYNRRMQGVKQKQGEPCVAVGNGYSRKDSRLTKDRIAPFRSQKAILSSMKKWIQDGGICDCRQHQKYLVGDFERSGDFPYDHAAEGCTSPASREDAMTPAIVAKDKFVRLCAGSASFLRNLCTAYT